MSTTGKASTVSDADAGFLQACQQAAAFPRGMLLAVAVARGCRHYAGLWPELAPKDRPDLPHEILGCALMRGPADAETFQSIRCGVMVLSDLHNSPSLIGVAAEQLGVTGRVAHIARLGLAENDHPGFWAQVQAALPQIEATEEDFLLGVSRLVLETHLNAPASGPVRTWLRTDYGR